MPGEGAAAVTETVNIAKYMATGDQSHIQDLIDAQQQFMQQQANDVKEMMSDPVFQQDFNNMISGISQSEDFKHMSPEMSQQVEDELAEMMHKLSDPAFMAEIEQQMALAMQQMQI